MVTAGETPDGNGMRRAPTIREVARIAGVSPMTVSRVLTGRGYVAEETAARVRDAFERLEYRPNPVARLLRGRRSHLIGVTIPSLTSSIHRGIVAGLEEVIGSTDYQVILGHLQAGLQPSSTFVELARRQHCDGYIIVPSRADAHYTTAAPLDRPAVAVLSRVPSIISDAVLVDGRDAVRAATTYLLEKFGDPVALIGIDSRLSHDVSVLDGYREALAAAGCEPWAIGVRGNEGGGREAVHAMLASPRPPRAFLFVSTMLIFECLAEIRQAGHQIGVDVGVASVTSEERPWTALLPQPIPIIVIPAHDLGRRAATRLLERFEKPGQEPVAEVLPMQFLPPEDQI